MIKKIQLPIELYPGDIILVRSTDWLGKVIIFISNWFHSDKVYYDHVAMVYDSQNIIQIRPTDDLKLISFPSFFSNYSNYKVIRYKNLTENQIAVMKKIGKDLLGLKYGVVRFIGFFIGEIFCTRWLTDKFKSKDDQVCSSLVAYLYYMITKIKFNNEPWESCEPDDIDQESLKPNSDFSIIYVSNPH